MNFALPAILIFLLVLPGIILRYTYARGLFKWNSPDNIRPITDEIAYSILFATAIHMFFGLILYYVFSIKVKIDVVLMLLIGSFGKDSKSFEYCIQSVTDSPVYIGIYFLVVNGLSACIGHVAHECVRKFEWDWKYKFFRFRNEWYYLLTGEINCFAEYAKEKERNWKPDMVAISGVIDSHDKSYLYVGRVVDFHFDKEGNLDRILINEAQRRELGQDKKSTDSPKKMKQRFYPIDGDYFILKYSEVKNLNIMYMYYEKIEKKGKIFSLN
jgi:hypothetical protein